MTNGTINKSRESQNSNVRDCWVVTVYLRWRTFLANPLDLQSSTREGGGKKRKHLTSDPSESQNSNVRDCWVVTVYLR